MTHNGNDEAISERMNDLNMRDRAEIITFCKDCYSPLMMSERWHQFALGEFAASLPTVEEYMEAGDYTGATAKVGLGIFAGMIGNQPLAPLIAPIEKMEVLQEVKILEDEDAEFIANILAMTTARSIAHIATCDNHDIGNEYAFFGELRYTIAQILFDVSEKYLDVAKNLGVLMLSAMKSKGVGYIEKNPALTYNLNMIKKLMEDAPIPTTKMGMQASDALKDVTDIATSYPAHATGILSMAMLYIQFGVVDLATAKALNELVGNYVEALQEAA